MSKREIKGLADVIAIAISPALIMAMVGALIFFLTNQRASKIISP